MTIKDLEPKVVWDIFYGLTQVPRPSKHEEKVQAFLLNWGKEHGIDTKMDETGNVIFTAPATPGYENRRGVIIQGHMDMVPQKTADTVHDFLTDPIQTQVVGEWLGAKGTTLGADNGIGLALGMAALIDDSVKHGPLEILATYDEETGMTGAEALKPGVLKGDILLNLDSEDEGELCVGCAGGLDASATFEYKTVPVPEGYVAYKLYISKLNGGHSGMDISVYRANANKFATIIALPMVEKLGAKIADFTGGSLRNAIPFEASVIILLPEDKVAEAKEIAEKKFGELRAEFIESDPNSQMSFEQVELPAEYIEDELMLRALKTILICPSSVERMSQNMKGLTETSINMAIVRTSEGVIRIHCLLRSAINSAKANLAEKVRCLFEIAGAKIEFTGGYPGWTPKLDTPMNKIMMEQYKKVYGEDMRILATHGGLECAILGDKYPNWEMVSVGPTIVHPHSPDERVHIASVARTWEYLKAVLDAIPEK